MKESNKNEVIVRSIIEEGLSHVEAAQRFNVPTRWIRTLLIRYHSEGLAGLQPRSRRTHTNPS
ncbi:helix-turn-helix domain-containing protein [Scrofimicrobium sp. R131]|uniref:Helix-turn-helix domain-containing protein n=1 Tax=Scrofimicrobium appendicitidis TaxID=3079930 RepID=A0AAU7V4B7_9ACTO